jgi:hypothetical protein
MQTRVRAKVQDLVDLREKSLQCFISGQASDQDQRMELDAITEELADLLTRGKHHLTVDQRANLVLEAILEDSDRRRPDPSIEAARAARRIARMRRLERGDPVRYQAELEREIAEDDLVLEADPDGVRMLRPILRALRRPRSCRARLLRVGTSVARSPRGARPAPVRRWSRRSARARDPSLRTLPA